MKTITKFLPVLLLPFLSAPVCAQSVTWTNFLRQRQISTGVELQTDVAASGSRQSLLPLE